MAQHVFYSLEKLIDHGRNGAFGYSCITFDLFDTLLIRRIHDPDVVKLPVARYIADLAGDAGISISPQAVQRARDRIEQAQRDETGRTFDDHEACYPVFMEQTLKHIFAEQYRPEILDTVTDYELSMESRVLVPRALFTRWLKELKELGIRTLVISDVYLPAEHLRKLLKSAGLLDLVEDVISSADTFLAKASGRAFPLVQERYDIDKSTWLHVGDNPISDGLRPDEFGIDTLVLKDGEEKYRKAVIKRYYHYGKGLPFYRGRALQQLMLPLEAENEPVDDLYVEGYNFIGPMVGAFVQHIAEECRRLGLRKIFFFSREGYTFKRVWERCMPILFPDGNLPETEYLYVSRMALAGASCAHEGLSKKSASIAMLPPGNKDFNDIARIFKLDTDLLAPLLQKHQLGTQSCLSPNHEGYDQKHSVRFMELLEDEEFQAEVRRQSADSNNALQAYLTEVGFFAHEQVAVVDIGWLGTIQRFLYNSVKHREDCPRFHGYLFAATRGIPYEGDLKNDMTGVIYDRHRFDLAASSILYARDVFEEACRAPHPTLDGYELSEDGYRLNFRTKDDAVGQAEKNQDQFYQPLQQGIYDSAETYAAASALLGYGIEDYRPWFHYQLTAKLAFPKTSEVTAIRHKSHLDDFHGSEQPKKRIVKDEKSLWDCSPAALRFLPLLRLRIFWKHVRNVIKS